MKLKSRQPCTEIFFTISKNFFRSFSFPAPKKTKQIYRAIQKNHDRNQKKFR